MVAWSGTHSSHPAKKARIRKFEKALGVSVGVVGLGWSETDPVVNCHFLRL